MIVTKGGSEFLYNISSNYPDTIMRVSDKDIKIMVKPTNNCQIMILAGIYNKDTGDGKVFIDEQP